MHRLGLICAFVGLLLAPAGLKADHRQDFQDLLAEWKKQAPDSHAAAEKELKSLEEQRDDINAELLFVENETKREQYQADLKKLETKMIPALKAVAATHPQVTSENRDDYLEMLLKLSFYAYQDQRYEESLAVSEYGAREFSSADSAVQLASLAAAAYAQLYGKAKPGEKKQALKAMFDFNDFMSKEWKDTKEGEDALGRLGQMALATGDRQKALDIAERLPDDSPAKGEIQIRFATLDYQEYFQLRNDPNTKPAELAQFRQKLIEKLLDACQQVSRTADGQVTPTLLGGELSLAHLYLESGEAQKAIELLEKPNLGVLDQLNSNTQAAQNSGIGPQAYQIALSAYMGVGELDKALATMEQMAKSSGQATDVTRLQLGLANTLNQQISAAQEAGNLSDPVVVNKIKGLGKLLGRLTENPKNLDNRAQTWVAQTIYKLADLRDPGGVVPAESVQELYRKCEAAYQELLEQTPKTEENERKRIGYQLRLAKCARRLGDHKEAMDLLNTVLREAPKNLQAQLEAAYTYQDWGIAEESQDYFHYAVYGGPDRRTAVGVQKSPIMGWNRLRGVLSNSSSRRDEYREVLYNLSLCLRNEALLESNKKKQQDGLETAERLILDSHRLNPTLLGPDWKPKFEALLVSIQKRLGREDTGFPE